MESDLQKSEGNRFIAQKHKLLFLKVIFLYLYQSSDTSGLPNQPLESSVVLVAWDICLAIHLHGHRFSRKSAQQWKISPGICEKSWGNFCTGKSMDGHSSQQRLFLMKDGVHAECLGIMGDEAVMQLRVNLVFSSSQSPRQEFCFYFLLIEMFIEITVDSRKQL